MYYDDTKVGVGRFFMALFSAGICRIYDSRFVGSVEGGQVLLHRLCTTQDFNLYKKNEVHAKFDDYDLGTEYVRQHGKPVMLDFTRVWLCKLPVNTVCPMGILKVSDQVCQFPH